MTGLSVQGEQLQVHGAGQGQGHSGQQFRLDIIYIYITYVYISKQPDAVQNVTVRKHPDVKVGLNYIVELAILFISEKSIWHPNLKRNRSVE